MDSSNRSPLILGIDAGFTGLGLALMELRAPYPLRRAWSVRTKPGTGPRIQTKDDSRRIAELALSFVEDVAAMEPRPAIAAVELATGTPNATTARKMGMGHGLIIACLELVMIGYEIVSPHQVKVQATGSRKGDKATMMDAALDRWPGFEWPKLKADREHAVDAAFAALWVAIHVPIARALAGVE